MEVYFPAVYVEQAELESYDGVAPGKYTAGLGQRRMAFCGDQEDVVSISLTAVKRLLEKYDIDPRDIGRLEVGTESALDRSKPLKSFIMALFAESGNYDIEGVDSVSACYGGTAALLNAAAWVESRAWDGRYALVVAADIAMYAAGPARPSGGCAAIAMLIGPDAPLDLERGLSASHMEHAYDFYKPAGLYPLVDGKSSLACYLMTLDRCYARFAPESERVGPGLAAHPLDAFPADPAAFQAWSYANRGLEVAALRASADAYEALVAPSTGLALDVGNMYTASVHASLGALVEREGAALEGRRILMYSYGSGLAGTLFSLYARHVAGPFTLARLAASLDIRARLESRRRATPAEFVAAMALQEWRYSAAGYTPQGAPSELRPGTYYLTQVDALYRRFYARREDHDV
ncbi:hypothetical protein WJX81_007826 [Elliptochloris bilobata]|uniref:Hydroxymethylglutaryl-CoA synthase n=1 Tax=Elliptochloris bilobata TaxID=381761 RepID=A0AAW1SBH9_9CHLO